MTSARTGAAIPGASTGTAVPAGPAPGGDADSVERAPLLRNPLPVAVIAPALAAVAFVSHPSAGQGLIAAFMAVVLVVVAATDIERRIIPNKIVLPATAIVLLAHVAFAPARAPEFILAGLGAGVAFLIPNLINSSLMGMGDVKLAMFLGVGLGSGVIGAIMVAFIAVFPVALGTLIRGGAAARKATLPFGPFLAFGGLVILVLPHLIVHA
jgi:leader peptidase (prepilin peptidase)/N-methyltransferase